MRSLLKTDGTIPEPESLTAAYSRLHRLTDEIKRIEQQLSGWVIGFNRADWLNRADEVRQSFTVEREQLREWIAKQEQLLFRDAVKLLRTLHDDDVGLTDKEEALLLRSEAAIKAMDEGGDGVTKTGSG